jgi:hypothetical protein
MLYVTACSDSAPSDIACAVCSGKLVQLALGHESAAETLDVYSHLWGQTMIRHAPPSKPCLALCQRHVSKAPTTDKSPTQR